MTPEPCPFCAIVHHADVNVREVYRDENVVAFFPTEPATLGHILVVPKKHVSDVWTLDENTAAFLGRAVVRLSRSVQSALRPEGLNIIQSNGEAATQTVPHLHVHLVPRWTGDQMGRIWPPETHYTEIAKDQVWEKLSEECRKASE